MLGRRVLLDDSVDMAESGPDNREDGLETNTGIGNASFVRDENCEEVDHVVQDDTASASSDTETSKCSGCCRQDFITVGVLICINLLNYMDRYTIPGVENQIIKYYEINNEQFGLLQTSFICSYMIFSPLFGYLGDRYNRKVLMTIGISLWTVVTAVSSFVEKFWLFILMRALIGIGEASYSTVAPTIFADLFQRDLRTKVLAAFYFAIPVGSGLGYIVGSQAAVIFGRWQWALRVTPIVGVVLVVLIIALVREPTRGRSEGDCHLRTTTYLADVRSLISNKSFVFTVLGFTAVSFVTGALAWWAPGFFFNAWNLQAGSMGAANQSQISLAFGIVTMVAGITGVTIGAETARRWRTRVPHVDALICGCGLLACTPFVYFALILSQYNIYVTFVLTLLGEIFICLNWSLVVDIMLAVVIPTRQATASGLQNLVAHMFGDAGSPWLVGMLSDSIKQTTLHPDSLASKYFSLQYALFTTVFVAAIGGGFFLLVALFYYRDRANYRRIIEGATSNQPTAEKPRDEPIPLEGTQEIPSPGDSEETQPNEHQQTEETPAQHIDYSEGDVPGPDEAPNTQLNVRNHIA